MEILFISLNPAEMNTSAMIRNKALIKGLVENGNKVDLLTIPVITNSVFYDDTDACIEGVTHIELTENKMYTSLVSEVKGLKGQVKKIILPALRNLYCHTHLFDNTIYTAKNVILNKSIKGFYDLIISSSDPKSSHVAARNLIKSGLKYGKWIQYWGDPLTTDITRKSIHPKWYVKCVEKRLFSFADKIVYVSPLTLETQKQIFVKHKKKMTFLPIPYIKEKYYDEQKIKKEKLRIGYFGDYNEKVRSILPLYNYCKNNNKYLIVAGNSDLKLINDDKINVLPRITQKEIEKYEEKCDILVCILNKSGTQIPGKIYHYAATNKPVLILLDGEQKNKIKKYLTNFDRFILCENDEDSIRDAINDVIMSDKKYQPSPHFEAKKIARNIIEMIKK